ncbi:MAG: hypothetical protein KAG61_13610 [Bacteriovoracaceae bacterium]|nr:hypothetical protein [Bacteriovoracaceae bacterium]
MTKTVALHGFLGDYRQWNDYIPLDLYKYKNLTELEEEVKLIAPSKIVGYSMGGRLALHLASLMGEQLERIIILGGNLGLESKDEIKKRIIWEEGWIKKIETLSADAFLNDWNQQTVFSNDMPIKTTRSREEILRLFNLFPLSKQPNFRPMVESKDRFVFAAGEYDHKYIKQYQEINRTFSLIKGCGHRILLDKNKNQIEKLICQGETHVGNR